METKSPREVADTFYDAFARRDAETMAGLYADTATFEDPVFGHLEAAQAKAMWRMLVGRAADLTASHEVVDADDERVRVAWRADYTFGGTGRKVHNEIAARMHVIDGLIVEHKDAFSFWTWSRQALGPAGLVAGWTPLLRSRVRSQALAGLAREKPVQP
ncbi:MAG: nuclear transport factor 2 family protein [Candidatus Nanopelagicales bacterium]